MSDHYATTTARRRFLKELLKALPGNSGRVQRIRMLEALRHGPITTNEARRFLDVFDPASRFSKPVRHRPPCNLAHTYPRRHNRRRQPTNPSPTKGANPMAMWWASYAVNWTLQTLRLTGSGPIGLQPPVLPTVAVSPTSSVRRSRLHWTRLRPNMPGARPTTGVPAVPLTRIVGSLHTARAMQCSKPSRPMPAESPRPTPPRSDRHGLQATDFPGCSKVRPSP